MIDSIAHKIDNRIYDENLYCDMRIFESEQIKFHYNQANIVGKCEWQITADYHTIYVYLGKRLRTFQALIEGGHWRVSLPIDGDIWIVPAGKTFKVQLQGTQFQFAELRIEQSALTGFSSIQPSDLRLEAKLALRDEFLHLGMRQLVDISEEPDKIDLAFAASLMETMCRYVSKKYAANALSSSSNRSYGPLTPEQYIAVERFIEENLSEKITLDQLAKITGQSAKRFLSDFTQTAGKTPIRFVIGRRISKAQSLLSCTAIDITDIAMMTGFSSHAHLTSTFKNLIGVSPSQYRRRVRNT